MLEEEPPVEPLEKLVFYRIARRCGKWWGWPRWHV